MLLVGRRCVGPVLLLEADRLEFGPVLRITDLAPLSTLTSLLSLDISNCRQISSMAPFLHLTALISLNMLGCSYVSNLTPLATLSRLIKLNLAECRAAMDLRPLIRCTSLVSLTVRGGSDAVVSAAEALRKVQPRLKIHFAVD